MIDFRGVVPKIGSEILTAANSVELKLCRAGGAGWAICGPRPALPTWRINLYSTQTTPRSERLKGEWRQRLTLRQQYLEKSSFGVL